MSRPSQVRLVALLLLAALVSGCSDDAPGRPEAEGTWTEAARMPLSPRWFSQVGWTGSEVLVVGGSGSVEPDDTGGGPGDALADGAAYDPETDSWRPIADAPIPVEYYFPTTMVGATMVVLATDGQGRATGWFAYDAGDDTWSTLPAPPREVSGFAGVGADGDHLLVTSRRLGYVMALDLADRTWSTLPPDDVEPRLDPYSATTDGADVFLCGPDPAVEEDGDTPRFVVVDRWDGSSWSRLPQSHQIGCPGHWTGERLVNADIQTAPGLDGDPAYGGRLDPATGEWSPLPDPPDPEQGRPDSIVANAVAGPLVAGWGFMYDDRDGTWTPFGHPDSGTDRAAGAAIVGGRLLVFGGRDDDAGYDGDAGLSDETWIWTPAAG